ncbi:MAG: heavy-metal-associated domain-containing protein, partial [Hyphomicrobium sp.]|nr:heavy-metal-associated domain-containing protein [Hyphomicrobium sp.]
MRKINLQVDGLLSPLGAAGVERHLTKLDGVVAVSVNQVSGSATISYDDAKIAPDVIEDAIEKCGHHCAGELVPSHLCQPDTSSPSGMGAVVPAESHHQRHDHSAMRPGTPAAAKSHLPAHGHAGHAMQMDDMSNEMGHGAERHGQEEHGVPDPVEQAAGGEEIAEQRLAPGRPEAAH